MVVGVAGAGHQRRVLVGAVGLGEAAPGVEPAAAGWGDRRRHVAGDELDAAALVRVGQRNGVEQRPRVGVAWCGEQLVGGGGLDDAAEVHHRHPVGDVLDDAEVVGHDEVGEVELVLQALAAG